MKHVVNFSGGVGSFWAAHRVIERHGVGNVVLLFGDVLIEDEDLANRIEKDNHAIDKLIGLTVKSLESTQKPDVGHADS